MGVYTKLLKVQNELKAKKSRYNKFSNFYYRSAEDILEGVKPLLKENGLIILLNDQIELIGERFYVKSVVRIVDAETGEHIDTTAFAREEESRKNFDAPQLTGGSSSYARKYALNGLFAIDDGESDPDNLPNKDDDKSKAAPNPAPKPNRPSTPLKEFTRARLGAINDANWLNEYMSFKGYTANLSEEEAQDILQMWANRVKQVNA